MVECGKEYSKPSKMKILVVTDGISPFVVGGMQKHSSGLIRNLVLRKHDVTMIHCLPTGMPKPSVSDVKDALGLEPGAQLNVISLYFPPKGFMPGHYLKSSYLFSRKSYELIKDEIEQFDFIYTKGFTGWYFIASKKKYKKIPPIGVNFHGYEMFQPGGSVAMRLKKYLLKGTVQWISKNADFVFSYGSKISDVINSIGVERNRILEVPTGIDASWVGEERMSSEKPLRFLFVGRYERRKGIEELTTVISGLSESADVEFHFIGPIEFSKRVIRKDVIYYGEIKDSKEIIRIMDSCHVLLCPSHSEGMPNVILEAMARGLAVVATDVGATNSLVDSNTGWLIDYCSTDKLKEIINTVVKTSDNDILIMGNSGLKKTKAFFLWEKVIQTTEDMIRKCL
jgi:glycosyltransferase involved in cell wall biosynthesis